MKINHSQIIYNINIQGLANPVTLSRSNNLSGQGLLLVLLKY
jgi:hypothetical protein